MEKISRGKERHTMQVLVREIETPKEHFSAGMNGQNTIGEEEITAYIFVQQERKLASWLSFKTSKRRVLCDARGERLR